MGDQFHQLSVHASNRIYLRNQYRKENKSEFYSRLLMQVMLGSSREWPASRAKTKRLAWTGTRFTVVHNPPHPQEPASDVEEFNYIPVP